MISWIRCITNMVEESERSENSVLKSIQEKRNKRREEERNVGWYSWLLSDYPVLVLFLCTCLIAGSVAVSVIYVDPPDFSEPSKGFEVRGTDLADRVVTWKNLYDNTGYNQTLATYPTLYAKRRVEAQRQIDKKKRRLDRKKNKNKRKTKNSRSRLRRSAFMPRWNFTENGYFCYNPKSNYARFVLESTQQSSLWSVEGLSSVCQAERALLNHVTYSDVCIHAASPSSHPVDVATSCCPTFSVSNYVAYLAGVSSCSAITSRDLRKVSSLLRDCAPFYANKSLSSHCWKRRRDERLDENDGCKGAPSRCVKYDAVFSVFHYLADKDFLTSVLKNDSDFKYSLRHTAVFLPAMKNRGLLDLYYNNFRDPTLMSGTGLRVAGVDFGLNDHVFDRTLQSDMKYPLAAMAAVMVIISFYTKSIFVTAMSVIASVSSLFMAFFLYTVIFEFTHFPFMNLTAIMVMVGVGADNVFVYCSAWKTYKQFDARGSGPYGRKNNGKLDPARLGVVTRMTLKHAARSMFVTGVTTASAFLANYASTVTAIKCFGVFTGLTVLMNLFMCVTWLPAAVIVHEKYFSQIFFTMFKRCVAEKGRCSFFKCCSVFKCLQDCSRVFFQKIQIYIIVKLRWFWLFVGAALAAGGCVAIFVHPKLRLPSKNSKFQYFKSSHHFEAYALTLSDRFDFENEGIGYMPVSVVFGIVPMDNGNPLDPDNKGSIVFDKHFDMSHPQSQQWLLDFCAKIRKQPFYKPHGGEYDDLKICFIEPFKEWMTSDCVTADNSDNSPCCKRTKFPYPPMVFEKCLKRAVYKLYNTISFDRLTPGPRFDENDTLRAVIVEFQSVQPYTSSYQDVDAFYKDIKTWIENETDHAPEGLRHNAWFRSELEFYSLQLGLYQGTVTAIGLSMGVVCVTLIVTTCSLTVTILANVTIASTIFMTVGVLVLCGWELNILESITVSIAIGLSVDFTVHYAVAYLLAPAMGRAEKVEHSASSMGPAIALAALTTFIAGLCMLPAQVSAYYKFGVFLMLIMTTSWFYGTYFFQSLCCVLGPRGTPKRCCDCSGSDADDRCSRSLSTAASKSSKTCGEGKVASSESQSAAMMEMSSCTSGAGD